MNDKIIAPLLIFTLGVSVPMAPNAALAQPPKADADDVARTVRLEVDAADIGGRAIGLENLMLNHLKPLLQAESVDIRPAEQSDVPILRFRIEVLRLDLLNYRLHFELADGSDVAAIIEPIDCRACFDHVLKPVVEATVPALVAGLDARVVAAADDNGPGENTDTSNGENTDGSADEIKDTTPPPKPIGVLGVSGVVALGLGLGFSIGGGVILANPRKQFTDPHEYIGVDQNRTPLGVALIAPGATLALAGVIMLAVDLSKRAKQRKSANHVTFIPTVVPAGAGIGAVGRF